MSVEGIPQKTIQLYQSQTAKFIEEDNRLKKEQGRLKRRRDEIKKMREEADATILRMHNRGLKAIPTGQDTDLMIKVIMKDGRLSVAWKKELEKHAGVDVVDAIEAETREKIKNTVPTVHVVPYEAPKDIAQVDADQAELRL